MITREMTGKHRIDAFDGNAPASNPPDTERAGQQSRARAWARILGMSALAVATLAGALTWATLPRWRNQQALITKTTATSSAPPRVVVIAAYPMAANDERVLPGNALPL